MSGKLIFEATPSKLSLHFALREKSQKGRGEKNGVHQLLRLGASGNGPQKRAGDPRPPTYKAKI